MYHRDKMNPMNVTQVGEGWEGARGGGRGCVCVRVPGTASAPTARAAACAPIFPPTPHPLPPTPMPACLPAHPGVAGDRDPRLPAPPTRAAPLRCVRGCRWDLPSPGARPQRWVGVGGWVHVGGWVGGWVGRWVGGQAGGWVGGWLWVGGWVHVGGCMWVGRAGGRAALTHAVTLPRGPPLSPPPMPSLPPPPPCACRRPVLGAVPEGGAHVRGTRGQERDVALPLSPAVHARPGEQLNSCWCANAGTGV